MQKAVLQAYPKAPLQVFVVWTNKLPFDGTIATRRAVRRFAGQSRVRQFYDPHDLTGLAIARALGASGKGAWDIYLFYAPGERWGDTPPQPAAWMHQLGWLDQAHHHSGDDLSLHLAEAAKALLTPQDALPAGAH